MSFVLRLLLGIFDRFGIYISVGRKAQPSLEAKLRALFPGVEFWNGENIMIGERVSIGSGSLLAADSPIELGDDTMIAPRVVLNTMAHSHRNHPMRKQRISRPIRIGKHVWIGSNAIILPGVKIGDYAVVGAGSVVTKHVPERAIVVGNPARIVRFRENLIDDGSGIDVNEGEGVHLDFLPEDAVTPFRNDEKLDAVAYKPF